MSKAEKITLKHINIRGELEVYIKYIEKSIDFT